MLKKAGVLNEAFVDCRTRAALRINAQGQQVVVSETVTAATEPIVVAAGESLGVPDGEVNPVVTTVEQRAVQVGNAVAKIKEPIPRRPDAPTIVIPVLRMSVVQSAFTLADITDNDRFRRLGSSCDRLFLEIPYRFLGRTLRYRPDFLVKLGDGEMLLIEGKGKADKKDDTKATAARRWVAAVNSWGKLGHGGHAICYKRTEIGPAVTAALAAVAVEL